ncbi:MAG TPA: oligoendopeptidase F [Vicinamibacterales bacterium]|nr:oligoendopeptidase F [Vicinamibacterales bacterium]
MDDKYTWDLTHIYPSDAAWQKAKEQLTGEIPKLRECEGKLGASASTIADALELASALSKELSRAYVYASMNSDTDTRVAKYQGMQQEMVQLAATLAADAAYVEPEILKIPRETIQHFIETEPRLKPYTLYLDDIQRRAAHTLSDSEERLLASAGVMASAPSTTYGIFSDADFPYPSVTLSDGKSVRLDTSGYSLYRAVPNRDDRQKVMSEFFGALGKFQGTFGSTLNSQIQTDIFYSRSRKYDSALEAALDGPNVPTSVYIRLVDGVNRHLPTFHRYLKLRQRMMKLNDLHYYDLYAPLVSSVDLNYSIEEATTIVLESLRPLGPEYAAAAARAFTERWTDWHPAEGKRAGAYSNGGAYDVHPYMLLNYNGKYNDMSTVAHELGHTMHSFFSNKTQPFPTASYPIFVAEVASTFNEALLIDYMLKTIKDDAVRLSLLGNYLEGIKSTVYRQTQFAEFELRTHEMAEKGQPWTGEALDTLYADITKRYYGHDKGICIVDDYVAHEWAFIPHFYRNFYVFQYATSFTAAEALAEKVIAGDQAATKRFLAFLSAGGSKYPIDLLKDAGVDMTTDEPLELTIKAMNRVMDQMEQLLK